MKILIYLGLNRKGHKQQEVIEITNYDANEWITFGIGHGYEIDDTQPIQKQVQHIVDKVYEEQYNADRKEFYHTRYLGTITDKEGNETDEIETIVDETSNPLEEMIKTEEKEIKRLVNQEFLNSITQTQKTRLELRMQGLTYKEIAEKEGVSVRSVRDSLEQMKNKYKEILKKYSN